MKNLALSPFVIHFCLLLLNIIYDVISSFSYNCISNPVNRIGAQFVELKNVFANLICKYDNIQLLKSALIL